MKFFMDPAASVVGLLICKQPHIIDGWMMILTDSLPNYLPNRSIIFPRV